MGYARTLLAGSDAVLKFTDRKYLSPLAEWNPMTDDSL